MPPRSKKSRTPEILAPVPDAVLDQFAPEGMLTAADVEAATRRFKKALLERALGAELGHHLTHEADTAPPLVVPWDRHGTFAPVLIPKHQRRFTGFDDKILALYARGLTVRDIQAFLWEMYAVDVSPDLISVVTDAVQEEVAAWHVRPRRLLRCAPREDARRRHGAEKSGLFSLGDLAPMGRATFSACGRADRGREILDEGVRDLQARGCRDILIAVTHGLTGMGEALEAVYPRTTWQTCVVHLLRRSLPYANWKERKAFAAALHPTYTAPTAEAAEAALAAVEASPWGRRFPTVMTAWRRAWPQVIPFFAFPPDIRRTIYTTNALENVNRQIRKFLKTRDHFPNDDAAIKLIWLAIRSLTARWVRGERHWKDAMNQFAILYGDRFERPQVSDAP